ncbi:MAG TPA: flagellar basal body-associated FliL family protein [bacterium]
MAEGEGGKGLGRIIRMAVRAIVVLVLVAGGGFAAWYFLLNKSADKKAEAGHGAPAASAARSSAEERLEHPQFMDLGTFIVNLADGRRYLKTTMQLLLSEEGAKAYLTTRLPEVKDLVLGELRSLSAESLRDPRTIEDLKQRILLRIESVLPASAAEWKGKDPRPVKKLLITEFYIQ